MRARDAIMGVARRLTGRNDLRALTRAHRLAFEKKLFRKPISSADFRQILRQLGFQRGRTIWVQSSWNQFYNVTAKPTDVLEMMLDELGAEGTLVMPAFPLNANPNNVLNIDTAAASTGLLTELFRRQRGVLRSINLTASVCAHGPLAEYLVGDHHREHFPWGKQSPYFRLGDIDAKLVTFGLPQYVSEFTPVHCVECILYDEMPYFQRVFDGTITYRWCRRNGELGEHTILRRIGRINERAFGGLFNDVETVSLRASNLKAFSIDAKIAISRSIDLGRRGITVYVDPWPDPALFASKN